MNLLAKCPRATHWLASLLFFTFSYSAQAAPEANLKVLGNSKAPKSGTLYLAMSTEPPTLNPIISEDGYSQIIHLKVLDTLMYRNLDTYQWEPGLAERVVKAPDGLSFIFYIRKGVKWSDGKPVTAQDVKFSYESVVSGKYSTAHRLPYYENIKSAEILKDGGVKFTVKKKYFGNFDIIAEMFVVPFHFYKDPKKKLNKTILGSGPYTFFKYQQGKSIVLKRNKNWWGSKIPALKGRYNYNKIYYRFVQEENLRLARLEKGNIDFLSLSAEQYMKKTSGKAWKAKIKKAQVTNSSPKGYSFIGWNNDRHFFNNRDTRVAMTHLVNRQLMNKKFRYNMSHLATGPWYNDSPYADSSVKAIAFNPKAAAQLLKKAGWQDTDKDGKLDRMLKGIKVNFEFKLTFASKDSEKYLTIIKEDFKKAGIIVHLQRLEWNSFVKALNEHNFDAVFMAWGAGNIDNDPKQVWHSSSSVKGSGSNFISYKNKKVDAMIEKARSELDRKKRIVLYKKIYRSIAEDAPYTFMFVNKFDLFGYSNKLSFDQITYKYDVGTSYWWIKAK